VPENVEIDITRVPKIAQAILDAALAPEICGEAKTTELFVALLTASVMLAIEARPEVPVTRTCEVLSAITQEFLSDVSRGKIKLAMRKKNGS
jgi:hypothetical protein